MATRPLEIPLILKDRASAVLKRFQKNVNITGRTTERAASRMIRAFTAFRGSLTGSVGALLSLKGAIVGAGIGFFAKSILDAAGSMETAEARLVGIKGSTEAAAEAMKLFTELASEVPFTLEAVVEAGVSLEAFGADSARALRPVADLAGFMGVEIPEAARAFGRAFAGGAGAADVLRDRGVLALVKLKAGVDDLKDLSLPQFRKALLDALEAPTGPIAGAAKRLAATWKGQLSIMSDAVFQLKLSIADAGLLEFAKEVVAVLTEEVKTLNETLKISKELLDENKKSAKGAGDGYGVFAKLVARGTSALLIAEGVFDTVAGTIAAASGALVDLKEGIRTGNLEWEKSGAIIRTVNFRLSEIEDEIIANEVALFAATDRTTALARAQGKLGISAREAAKNQKVLNDALKDGAGPSKRLTESSIQIESVVRRLGPALRDGSIVMAQFQAATDIAARNIGINFLNAEKAFKSFGLEATLAVQKAVDAVKPEDIIGRIRIFTSAVNVELEKVVQIRKKLTAELARDARQELQRLTRLQDLIQARGTETIGFLSALSAGLQASTVASFASTLQSITQFSQQLRRLGEEDLAARVQVQQTLAATIGASFAAISSLATTFGSENLALQKSLGVAQVAIQTSIAIMRALAELGPIAGPIAVAGIAALGIAQIAAILAARPGRGTIAGGGALGGGAAPAAPPPPAMIEAAPTQVNISFSDSIIGDESVLADTVVRLVRQGVGDGLETGLEVTSG